ncbi:MAG: histone deacetylase [Microthrixaceae bacterium]|nr:histone deacetylase [Microthrixaceae bacterium]
MSVLFSCETVFREHDTGPFHPERPERIDAVDAGIRAHHLGELLLRLETRPASDEELGAVHPKSHVAAIERFAAEGGGHLDPDTVVSDRSAELARLGSGTLLRAVELLGDGVASAAFVAVRPPGHHATRDTAMGFCLYNHVAVAAARLTALGDRVVVVDIDAHHGNGTQDIFYDDPMVMYVSWHQSPHYPNSGSAAECGGHQRWAPR